MMEIRKVSWWHVEKGHEVVLDGTVHVVKKVTADELVVVERGTRGVKRLPLPKKKARRVISEEPDLETEAALKASIKAKAASSGRAWTSEGTPLEQDVRSILGATLVGIEADGSHSVPPVGPSTLKAHLRIYHGLHAGHESYERLVARHESDHAGGDPMIPHEHVARRPA